MGSCLAFIWEIKKRTGANKGRRGDCLPRDGNENLLLINGREKEWNVRGKLTSGMRDDVGENYLEGINFYGKNKAFQ